MFYSIILVRLRIPLVHSHVPLCCFGLGASAEDDRFSGQTRCLFVCPDMPEFYVQPPIPLPFPSLPFPSQRPLFLQ